MKVNVGGIDRITRIIIGIILISQVFIGLKTPWGWVGVITVLTGLFRFCPLYPLIGLNTCSSQQCSSRQP